MSEIFRLIWLLISLSWRLLIWFCKGCIHVLQECKDEYDELERQEQERIQKQALLEKQRAQQQALLEKQRAQQQASLEKIFLQMKRKERYEKIRKKLLQVINR